jgi:hypothetical protein
MRVFPQQGMPKRGSLQDRLVQEMLYREQRREIHRNVFLGQLISAGLNVPPGLFQAWVDMYRDEVTHDNYNPQALSVKRKLQTLLNQEDTRELDLVKRVQGFEITSHEQMQPYSKEGLERVKEILRKRARTKAERRMK